MKVKAVVIVLALVVGMPLVFAERTCRTDSFGTTRGSDGTTCRTDSFGTMRCN